MELSGKRVLITGGASGLGLALANAFSRAGARIAIADINQQAAEAVVKQLSANGNDCFFVALEITDVDQWQNAVDALLARWDGLDILVNNAGVAGTVGAIDQIDEKDWRWVIDINLHGTVNGCRACVPLLKNAGGGVIINTASAAGLMNAPMMSSYNVSKAAVVSLSETLHMELERFNIQTVVACPAFFKTNLTETMRSHVPGMQDRVERMMTRSNISADDVANQIIKAIHKKKFMLVTHPMERRLWLLKRFWPSRFYRLLIDHAKKMVGKKDPATSEQTETP